MKLRALSKLPQGSWKAKRISGTNPDHDHGGAQGAAGDHERQGEHARQGDHVPRWGGHRLDRWREALYAIYIHFHMKYKENLFAA